MPDRTTPPIWRKGWFQFLLGVLLVLAVAGVVVPPVLGLLYAARSVLVPVVIALALAYAVNPAVNWMQARLKMPRALSAVVIMLAVALVFLSLFIYLAPTLYMQTRELFSSSQHYAKELTEQLDMEDIQAKIHSAVDQALGMSDTADSATDSTATTPPSGSVEPATPTTPAATTAAAPPETPAEPNQTDTPAAPTGTASSAASALSEIDFESLYKTIAGAFDVGFGVVSTAIGFTSYLALSAVIIVFCFFFFVWKFSAVTGFFVPFIPIQYRDRTLELLGMMDQSVSGFIRGRIVQVTCVAVVLSVGWWLAGVPYWLLLGILGGLLNLIPYAAVIAWPLAVLLAWLHGLSMDQTFNFWHVVFWPSLVYFVAQGLDGWVVEPLVQGKATDLDPLTVLLCVLIGGSLLGLLGMLIAIPATACIKILLREVILPRLRKLAADRSVLD